MIKDLIVIAILFISTLSFSQATNSSPYSLFGIGDQANLKTVEEIAQKRPKNYSELARIHGLGETKIAKYGKELLGLVGQ